MAEALRSRCVHGLMVVAYIIDACPATKVAAKLKFNLRFFEQHQSERTNRAQDCVVWLNRRNDPPRFYS